MIGIEEEKTMNQEEPIQTALGPHAQRSLLVAARMLSAVFRPGYYPSVVFLVLLNFTFLQMLPFFFKLYVLCMVYLFTIVFPSLGIYVYRQLRGFGIQELRSHHKRLVPYVINILCYLFCLHFVWRLRLPSFVLAILGIAILVQCVCTIITIWWKISMHSAAAGTVIGILAAYSLVFGFNPIWWLCLAILVSGLVNSSRMLLRQHTLWQVLGGTCVGIVCGLLGIMII